MEGAKGSWMMNRWHATKLRDNFLFGYRSLGHPLTLRSAAWTRPCKWEHWRQTWRWWYGRRGDDKDARSNTKGRSSDASTICQKCSIKLDLRHLIQPDERYVGPLRRWLFDVYLIYFPSKFVPDQLPHEPRTPPTRTSQVLKANLQSVNSHLNKLRRQWEEKKKKLLGAKAVLEDAANRLNGQVKGSKEEAKKIPESNRIIENSRTNTQSVRAAHACAYIWLTTV